MSVEYRFVTALESARLAELAELYVFAGWIPAGEPADFLPGMIAGSAVFIAAFDSGSGRLIGCGRALSDGASDGYIQDIAVHPQWRRRGIGGEIVMRLARELERRGVDWIGLVGEPGTESFYRGLGFERQPGFTLWKFPVNTDGGATKEDRC